MDVNPFNVMVAEDRPIVSGGLLSMLGHITAIHIHPIAIQNERMLQNLLAARRMDLLIASPDFGGGFDFEKFALRHPTVPCLAIISDVAQLRKIAEGQRFITIGDSAENVEKAIEGYCRRRLYGINEEDEERRTESLSQREKEIVACLARGMSNKEVADRLCLSVYTVMTHRRNICRKTHIHSLSGLTIYAIANNLIDVENKEKRT